MRKEIVITGMGTVNSIGYNIKEFTESLRNGKAGFKNITDHTYDISKATVYAPIEWEGFSSFKSCVESFTESLNKVEKAKKILRRCNNNMQWAGVAALEAWEQALLGDNSNESSISIIVSGSNLNQNMQYSLTSDFIKAPEYINPRYALNFMDTDFVGTLSEIFEINGEGFSIGGASASGNVAVIKAMQQIRYGISDVCIVIGGPTVLSPMEMQAFINIGAMDSNVYENTDLVCRPFDEQHKGFVYGQAAGCIIVESKEHAEKRNAKILAELLGGNIVLDGNRLTDPNTNGEIKAMRNAVNDAGLNLNKIEYINTHGTASKLGDETELNAIKSLFSEHSNKIYLNSTKGYTGHCLFSAGVIELIATVIQMENRFIHANKGLVSPITSDLNLPANTVENVSINYALNNSFGFGGINTCVVVGKK